MLQCWVSISNLKLAHSWLEAVHKRTYTVSRSGELPSADIFRTGAYSDADVRPFYCKNIEFFKIYSVSARTGG